MKPGRELDALIAEKVMGIRATYEQGDYWPPARPGENFSAHPIRHYSTSIADAWEVVERLEKYYNFTVSNEWDHSWHCHVKWHLEDNTQGETEVEANSAPLAICLAALNAVN